MIQYHVNLFGHRVSCTIKLQNDNLVLEITSDGKDSLENYLSRTILNYDNSGEDEKKSLQKLMARAVEIENSIGTTLKEPTLKLPYEVLPETKEKLVEAARLRNVSATHLLIEIIGKKYKQIMNESK